VTFIDMGLLRIHPAATSVIEPKERPDRVVAIQRLSSSDGGPSLTLDI
jgi:hypothetical protein